MTVMIRLLMIPPPETGVRWAKQACHTSQMDRPRMRGEELAVAAPARPSGRDGVMASPHHSRGGGGCWKVLGAAFQHVLTASTVTRMTNLSTVPYAYEPGLIARLFGVALEAAHAYGVRLLLVCHSHLSIAHILCRC